MNMRTLVTHRLYFGMDALALRGAMTRVLARVAGLPPLDKYLFIDGGNSVNFIANPRGAAGVPASFDQNFHVIKTGLNYKFGTF